MAARDDGPAGALRLGRLEIDPEARQARLDGRACALTVEQFALLQAMAGAALGMLDAARFAGAERLAALAWIGETLADAVAGAAPGVAAGASPARRAAEGR